ncbi:MAG: class I SAM-dependent methyltransferase [Planctomycetes bacterium]|nr:class I SAM-dependent methyltransferase [Planctomycetota bacterium]
MSDETHLYRELALAYVRGARPTWRVEPATLLERARGEGLAIHRFKRTAELPRVRAVLGMVHGFQPSSLLDVGSGRGVFLWPLLDRFACLNVTSIDCLEHRVRDLGHVRHGGLSRLQVARMDVTATSFANGAFDVVTCLEVLEHLVDPTPAVPELLRIARRAVLVTVPSREDDNPEHLRVYTPDSLRRAFLDAGACQVQVTGVLGHLVACVTP